MSDDEAPVGLWTVCFAACCQQAERLAREAREVRGTKGSWYEEQRRLKDAARDAQEAAQVRTEGCASLSLSLSLF